MNKFIKAILTGISSLALVLGFSNSPANANPAEDNNPLINVSISGTAEVGQVLTAVKPMFSWTDTNVTYFWNRCTQAVTRTYGDSNIAPHANSKGCQRISMQTASTYTLTASDVGKYISVEVLQDDRTTPNGMPAAFYSKSLAASILVTAASSSPSPTPSPTSSSTPAASATPAAGTAEALATKPKSATQPKLNFDSSSNGLSSSSKKSLKKVADVAKDGYGVRVTGAAGMQPGVSKDVVKALAKKRALEIRDYLVKQGVDKEDIIIKTKIFPIGKAPSTLVKVETLS